MRTTAALAIGLLVLIATGACAQQNVALTQPYICSVEVLSGWTGLVDGVIDSDGGPGCFATVDDPAFPKLVTIDLQRPCAINRIAVHNSANGNTRHITISISADGRRFEQLREFIFPNNQAMALNHRFGDRRAQFVRIGLLDSWGGGLGGDNCIFMREVEVFGSPTGEPGVRPPAAEPTGDPLVRTRSLRLFERYALQSERQLKIVVMGDSLAAGGEGTWPALLKDLLDQERPEGAETLVVTASEPGLDAVGALGQIMDTAIAADPDLLVVTLGTDSEGYLPAGLRGDLAMLLERLAEETGGLVVVMGPAPDPEDAETLDSVRAVANELENTALFMDLPMLRTERALLVAGVPIWEKAPADGGNAEAPARALTEDARRVIAEKLMQLLTQP